MIIDSAFGDITEKLATWGEDLVLMLPNLVVAIFIVLASWLVARLARKGVTRLSGRVSSYRQVNQLLSTVAYVAVFAVGTFVALDVLALEKAVTSLLAGAGIIGLALGFAFQDIASNVMSGILISFRRPFRTGDIIQSNDAFGTVQDVNLRATVIRTLQGQDVIIPNKDVYQNPLKNYSVTGSRRIDLECGVAYGDDLEEAEQVAVEAISSLPSRDDSRDVQFFYTEFGGSSVDFQVRFWIKFESQPDYLAARSHAIKALKKSFDKAGLTIPFPIRTLDFGVVGGDKLAEALPAALLKNVNGAGATDD